MGNSINRCIGADAYEQRIANEYAGVPVDGSHIHQRQTMHNDDSNSNDIVSNATNNTQSIDDINTTNNNNSPVTTVNQSTSLKQDIGQAFGIGDNHSGDVLNSITGIKQLIHDNKQASTNTQDSHRIMPSNPLSATNDKTDLQSSSLDYKPVSQQTLQNELHKFNRYRQDNNSARGNNIDNNIQQNNYDDNVTTSTTQPSNDRPLSTYTGGAASATNDDIMHSILRKTDTKLHNEVASATSSPNINNRSIIVT